MSSLKRKYNSFYKFGTKRYALKMEAEYSSEIFRKSIPTSNIKSHFSGYTEIYIYVISVLRVSASV